MSIIRKITHHIGRKLVDLTTNKSELYRDIRDQAFWQAYVKCKPYTMTSIERMYALYQGVQHVVKHQIPGDFVECGVWRGGSAMLIACALQDLNVRDRKILLFDTFEGMSDPTDDDINLQGKNARQLMDKNIDNKETSVWCLARIDEVRSNMERTGYPAENIRYIEGKVEETIPSGIPESSIALLRLDTDWYTSTKHELVHLYPRLTPNGVLIIDDYGHWEGCRKAVDEYFHEHSIDLLEHRIDYTGRLWIKTN